MALSGFGCASRPVELRVPRLAENASREPTAIELLSISAPREENAIIAEPKLVPGDPAAAFLRGMRTELSARAFRGGEPGGYVARCHLDRMALRRDSDEKDALLFLYVDMGCELRRKADRVAIWRGELRGRNATAGSLSLFSDDEDTMNQVLCDRLMSDTTRELVSDLAVRALGLSGHGSARLFDSDDAEHRGAGVDDAPFGLRSLAQSVEGAKKSLEETHDSDSRHRAAAWNAVAMAASPGGPWLAGIDTVFDRNVQVRFYQYKALARHASPATLRELKVAQEHEKNDLLIEFLKDLQASGGLPLMRRVPVDAAEQQANAVTNGTTTSP